MADIVPMLALSPTMDTGTITEWHKQEGDAVDSGDVLCDVETDKAVMEYESNFDGVLLKILVGEGDDAAVGDPIAIVGDEDDDIDDLVEQAKKDLKKAGDEREKKDDEEEGGEEAEEAEEEKEETEEKQEPEEEEEEPKKKSAEKAKPEKKEAAKKGKRPKVSPAAARLAAERGVDLSEVDGSGPDGRITLRDIKEFEGGEGEGEETEEEEEAGKPAKAKPAAPSSDDREVPLSRMRLVIAQRMTESKQNAPHFTIDGSVRMEMLIEERKRLNEVMAKREVIKISVNDFLIKACALALAKHRVVNSSFDGDKLIEHGDVNVGLAVAQGEGEGLITPVVKHADRKSLRQISVELVDLINRAREGKLKPHEYQTGTFTISNMGMYDVDSFTAIINPPQAAILAVGATRETPVRDDDGEIRLKPVMKVTLSCDHRVVDGVAGALFLNDVKTFLEVPLSMMM